MKNTYRGLGCPIYATICVLFLSLNALAGTLEEFEEDTTHWEEPESEDNGWGFGFFMDIFGDLFAHGIVEGGRTSWERVRYHPGRDIYQSVRPRDSGEILIPFLRFDASYQDVETDVEASDYRFECGYGPFGAHVNYTHYREREPDADLELIRIYGLYRMSFGDQVETDLGFGVLTMEGEDLHSGFSFTIPAIISPYSFLGIAFRPAWANMEGNDIGDYDLGLFLNWRQASLKVGYRWVERRNTSLNGPYVGFSLRL